MIVCKDVDWIHLAWNRDQCLPFAITVISLQVKEIARYSWPLENLLISKELAAPRSWLIPYAALFHVCRGMMQLQAFTKAYQTPILSSKVQHIFVNTMEI
jgi:hypothetical protein